MYFSFYNLPLLKKLEKLEVFCIFFLNLKQCDGYQYCIHLAIYFLLNRRISYQDFNFWRVNIFPSIFFHYYYICLSGGLVSAAFHNYFNGKNYLKERFSLYDKIEKHACSTAMNFFLVSGTNVCTYVLHTCFEVFELGSSA